MYRQFIGRRVLLIMADGTLDGTLAEVHKDGVIMNHVTFVAEDGESRRPMDGVILVPLANIAFGQVV